MNDTERLEKEYLKLDFLIQCYTKGKWRAYSFLRRLFCFLRLHPELINRENGDYKELYDETLIMLILHARVKCDWTKNEPKDQAGYLELLTDLENAHSKSCNAFSFETVEDYLLFRKKSWSFGNRYTKEILL
ncbi:MAG: hypothetical protein J6C39_00960, partial [Clostridia bacterium]|nr:hypothetical protein [Clostridia bacterium]